MKATGNFYGFAEHGRGSSWHEQNYLTVVK